jgi:DNA anti-recombination protein RmuC
MCQDLDRLGTHLRNAASAYDSVAGAKAGAVERSLAAVGESASDEAPALRHTAEVKSPS